MAPNAVIFDLDDTLSDHIGCVRAGLAAQQQRHIDVFGGTALADLERLHSDLLEPTHLRLLAGEISKKESRTIRTQQLFAQFGVSLSADEAMAEYTTFRVTYDEASAVVPGTNELLDACDSAAVRLGIITNNLVAEQHKKLHLLGLFDRFEMLTISEEVGTSKPDPKIFHVALERMALDVDDVVMVGDSLQSDIAGALGVNMACVWLDRREIGESSAPAGVQSVIARDFSDTHTSLDAILGA